MYLFSLTYMVKAIDKLSVDLCESVKFDFN